MLLTMRKNLLPAKIRCLRTFTRAKIYLMTPTNTSLIFRVRNLDDHASWREFVQLYEPLLVSYVRSRGLSINDANDVVQEIFISLLRALPNFSLDKQRGRFRTWLYQVTMNAVINHGRRAVSRNKAEDGFKQHVEQVAPGMDEPDEEFVQAHRKRVLEFVLPKVQESTQPKTWVCFEQHVLKGRPGTEIAKELGITANAVCVNAGRVLEKVRALCSEYLEEIDDE
jgi:RNA polymerase sigma-70 factor, ECF subfamily